MGQPPPAGAGVCGSAAMLLKMSSFMNLNTDREVDFSAVEERLHFSLPEELKKVYTAIHGREEYFSAAEHFLPLDELYTEQGLLVFFQKKRTPIAGYDMESGCLAEYYKKEWHTESGGFSCFQFCTGRMVTIALETKPVFKKGRCRSCRRGASGGSRRTSGKYNVEIKVLRKGWYGS